MDIYEHSSDESSSDEDIIESKNEFKVGPYESEVVNDNIYIVHRLTNIVVDTHLVSSFNDVKYVAFMFESPYGRAKLPSDPLFISTYLTSWQQIRNNIFRKPDNERNIGKCMENIVNQYWFQDILNIDSHYCEYPLSSSSDDEDDEDEYDEDEDRDSTNNDSSDDEYDPGSDRFCLTITLLVDLDAKHWRNFPDTVFYPRSVFKNNFRTFEATIMRY